MHVFLGFISVQLSKLLLFLLLASFMVGFPQRSILILLQVSWFLYAAASARAALL